MRAFLLVFSAFVNAPLLGLANPNQTPNPSKAPWYFLGLQELVVPVAVAAVVAHVALALKAPAAAAVRADHIPCSKC